MIITYNGEEYVPRVLLDAEREVRRQLAEVLRMVDLYVAAKRAEANYPGCEEGEIGDAEHAEISRCADAAEMAYEVARDAALAASDALDGKEQA